MAAGSEGGFPPQHQDKQPGQQTEMRPRPEGEARSYKAAGKLEGRVALITGGDSGIGRAVAVTFAKEGADIAILYKSEDKDAAETARLIADEGRDHLLIKGDIADESFCNQAVQQVIDRFGALHILVNNAAEQHYNTDFATIETAQIERTFRTNVFGHFFLTRAALPHLAEGASIINTTSVTAYRGSADLVDYAATKGALLAFTRSLAKQLAERGIRVNGVAPGPVWTPLIPASFPPDKVKSFGTDTPLGRAGQPDEIAPCYVLLASDDGSYITGQVIHPNGGEIVGS
ncbi:MAG TPA: SDR family oxidoreductase [Sphingomonadales bacterium]